MIGHGQGIEGADAALARIGVEAVGKLAEDLGLTRLRQDEGRPHLPQGVVGPVTQHGVMSQDLPRLVAGDPGQKLTGADLLQDQFRVVDDLLVAVTIEIPGGASQGEGLLGGLKAPVADGALDVDPGPLGLDQAIGAVRGQRRRQPLDHLEFLTLLSDIAPVDVIHDPFDEEGAQALGRLLEGVGGLVTGQVAEVEGPALGPGHQADGIRLEFDEQSDGCVHPRRDGVFEKVGDAFLQGQLDLATDGVGDPQAGAEGGKQGLKGRDTGGVAGDLQFGDVGQGHGCSEVEDLIAPVTGTGGRRYPGVAGRGVWDWGLRYPALERSCIWAWRAWVSGTGALPGTGAGGLR